MTHIDGTARPLASPSPSAAEDGPLAPVLAEDEAVQEHRLPRWLMVASTTIGLLCGVASAALFVTGQEEAALAAAAFGAGALGGPRVTINIRK
ncbi:MULTISPECIES: hypothetical protein [Streptomyces]|uniref:Uncharacterized protein n=2 Tax=Streptomyces TaxID=1883 RepID=A0ABU4KDR9_9ACTN|nr:hypothetical protein [Streptomyces roseolus]MDX2295886.1 hypothetical protein [Streptomyces roseolus]